MHGVRTAPRSLAFDYAVGAVLRLDFQRFLSRRVGARPRSGRIVLHAVSRRILLGNACARCWSLPGLRCAITAAVMPGRDALPRPYRVALIGIPIFIGAGVRRHDLAPLARPRGRRRRALEPDASGHRARHLLSRQRPDPQRAWPTALARRRCRCQLPLALGLATWLLLAHFGTAYAFDPAAGRTNAPPPIAPFTPDYLTALGIGYYRVSIGVLIVIFQSALIGGFALWLVSRIRARPGMFTLVYSSANFRRRRPSPIIPACWPIPRRKRSLTGIVADVLVARCDPQPERVAAFRWFAVVVPMTYIGVYLVATILTDGTWWDWNVALGAVDLVGRRRLRA